MTTPYICDCGHPESKHSDITRGFGTDANGKTHCYACCAERDKQAMRDDGRAALYLCEDNRLTNWPGSLVIHPHRVRKGRHNMTGVRYDVWFSFEGKPWYGVLYGHTTQICHCRRLKA